MLGLFAFMGLSVLNSPKTRIAIHETLLMALQAAFYRLDLRVLYSVVIGLIFYCASKVVNTLKISL